MPCSRILRMMAISSLMSGAVRPAAGSSSSSSLRVERQRAADLEQALLAVGQVARFLVGEVGKADELQHAQPRGHAPRSSALVARRVQRHVEQIAAEGVMQADHARSRSAVISPNSCTFWNVRAMPRQRDLGRRAAGDARCPSNSIAPAVGT